MADNLDGPPAVRDATYYQNRASQTRKADADDTSARVTKSRLSGNMTGAMIGGDSGTKDPKRSRQRSKPSR